MIAQLQDTFGTRMKSLEILLLLKDKKPVVRHAYYPHELEKVKHFCKKNNIFVEISPHKIILQGDKFSNKGAIVSADNPHGAFLAYISKDHLSALQTCLAETKQNQRKTGELLGYPPCCINYFCRVFNEHNTNPEHPPSNPWTNLTKRSEDIALISHFPCHPTCSLSIELAQTAHELLSKYEPQTAELFIKRLSLE
jgi:hypothetical protein